MWGFGVVLGRGVRFTPLVWCHQFLRLILSLPLPFKLSDWLDYFNKSLKIPPITSGFSCHYFLNASYSYVYLPQTLYSLRNWQRFQIRSTAILFFMFMWPCIVTNFLIIKPARCTNFSNLFWNETPHVPDSSSVHHQELFTVHSAMVYVIQVCRQLLSRIRMESSSILIQPVWHIPLLCVRWETPDDGQRNCPEHVEFHSKTNLRN
jgi:hypothetical protein